MDGINTSYQNINSVSNVINQGRADVVREGLNVDKAGLDLLREMSTGETFRGQIVDINQNVATILVGDDARITANVNPDINLSVGQTVLFEVNSDTQNLVSLRTLFTNIANENIANNALNQANIPVNATSLALVSTLMEQGMSIDKDSLALLYRNIVSNPEVAPNEIIRMKQIGLDLTSDNIARFDAVMNFESKISDSINTVINQIPLELSQMADKDLGAAINMAMDFIDASTEGETQVSISLGDSGLSNESLLAGQESEEGLASGTSDNAQSEAKLTEATVKNIISDINEGSLSAKDASNFINENIKSVELSEQITLTNRDFDSLNALISKDNEFANNIIDKLSNGEKIDLEELLKTFDSILKDENISDEAKKGLLKSELFKETLTDKFSEKWLMEPADIKDSESLNNHYNKVMDNTQKILDSMQNAVKGSENLTQTVSQFRENVQFLQTLNDLTPYVQLPVLLNNKSNTGDLYVYANKKNLLADSENLSAALRLDMKNLGRVDVYVRLSPGKHLSTDFTLPDEDTLMFIEQHIDMLNDKLEELGFKVTNSFNTKKQYPDVLMEEEDTSDKKDAIGFYRFDVRA
ncbi:MAG: flagellar hook-length control protein FliK [Lachnospiraceae bacterium]|nr:flagellar hook-length control protein FliK [Lachnospiraceae bacterium]